MRRCKVLICSFAIFGFMLASSVGVYADHVHKVELLDGQFIAKSQELRVDMPSKLRLHVQNGEDSAGSLYYKVYEVKTYTGIDDEGKEEIVKWNNVIMSGMLRNSGKSILAEKEVQAGRYYVELSTVLWLPAIGTPTCQGQADLIRVDGEN